MRPFVRVSANLSLTPHGIRRQRAAVQRAEAAGAGRRRRRAEPTISRGAEPDAEVSYVTRDLAGDPAARSRSRRRCRSTTSSRACATPPTGPAASPTPLPGGEPAVGRRARWPMRPTARPIPTPASRPASCRRTSRCCRRPAARSPAATPGTSARHRQEGREHRDDPQGASAPRRTRSRRSPSALGPRGRANGLKEGQKLRILRRRDARRHAAAADPRHRAGRQHDRCGGRAVRHGQVRLGRRRQHEHAGRRRRATTTTRTTARACGSTRASTRPRCATRSRRRVIESLIRIYSYDVDFQHKAQPGDSFDVLYAGEDDTPTPTPRTTCCSPR